MIVLIETNFIIELAALQAECEHAKELVTLAEKGRITLVVPAFSLTETFETYGRWRQDRNKSSAEFDKQLRQLARSQDHAQMLAAAQTVSEVFAKSAEVQTEALRHTIKRVINCAQVLPLTDSIALGSLQATDDYGLEAQDAVVFCTVEAYLKTSPGEAVFVNKDRKGFLRPEVSDHFESMNCKTLPRIEAAAGYIKSRLA